MFTDYFGLKENPFSIAPDPGYLYMSERHREALAHLLYGLKTDGGFVLLTGEVGTGKTTICRRLLDQIPDHVDLAYIFNPKVTVNELLETICDELQIERTAAASIKALVDLLNQRLLDNHARERKTVLLIDEAQNLSAEVLEQLRLLTNLETSRRKLLQIILLGQPELRDLVNRAQMSQLAQRVTARYHLKPLEKHDIAAYVAHRLKIAGCDRPLFTSGAIRRINRLSRGVPRLINLLCDRALLGALTQQKARVDAATVRQAGREVFDRPSGVPTAAIATLLLLAALLLGGLATWGLIVQRTTGPWAENPQGTESSAVQLPLPEEQQVTQQVERLPVEPAPPSAVPIQPADTLKTRTQDSVPLPRTWPQGFGYQTTLAQSYAQLAALWGLSGPANQQEIRRLGRESGLRLMTGQDNLESLRNFDRPAVLTLYNDRGAPFYVLLERLNGSQARFVAAENRTKLDISALESRWFGEFALFWNPPESYRGIVMPGEADPVLAWLAASLRELGHYQGGVSPPTLSEQLLGALKRFQFNAGLTPDGILGPKTLIRLNHALDISGPRLARSAG
jgi:general secretion pathway protein A